MIPTIGRIVIYNTTHEERVAMENYMFCNVQRQVVAIIVAISESDVNLRVICDGSMFPIANGWIRHVKQGDGEGQWNWPPRA